jgi:hypothetical protein
MRSVDKKVVFWTLLMPMITAFRDLMSSREKCLRCSTPRCSTAPSALLQHARALSADEKTLYVANADTNCLPVNVSFCRSKAQRIYIPVGWYPPNIISDRKKIFVSTGKFLFFLQPAGQPHHATTGGDTYTWVDTAVGVMSPKQYSRRTERGYNVGE